MKTYLPIFTSVILLVSGANAYSAVLNVFDNSSDYSAATASELFLIDFNGSANTTVDGSTISTHATFGSPEASSPTNVVWSSNALTDAGSTTAINGVGPLSIDFSDPSILAFSLDFLSSGEQETVELYDSGNLLFASVLSPNASGFFGVVSDTAIDYVIIRNGIFPSTLGNDRFFIDNLSANTVVPVPAAVWLFGSGLIGLIGVARRKKS